MSPAGEPWGPYVEDGAALRILRGSASLVSEAIMLNGVPRILIVRLSAIGDVVRVLPALHAVHRLYPNAQLDWVVESKSAAILEGHPLLDQVLVVDRASSLGATAKEYLRIARQIRRSRYDYVLDFHGILKSGLLTAASGAEHRYGFSRPRSQELSYLATNHKVKLPSGRLNRIEENLLFCKDLGADDHELDVTIWVPPEVEAQAHDFMENAFHGGKKVVAMHVPVDREEKQWPLSSFAQLADMLLSDGRFDVLLTWGPGQLDCIKTVQKRMERSAKVAPELPSLKHYAGLVAHSDLFFGGDTGPMHIASAMGVPTVVVFGGTHPDQHGPMRDPYRILYYGAGESSTCTWKERLEKITPDAAYESCVSVFFS